MFKKPALLGPLVKVVMFVFMRIPKNVKSTTIFMEKKKSEMLPKKFEFRFYKKTKNHYYIKNTKTILKYVMLLFVLEWTHRLQRVPYGHRKDYEINTHTVNYSKKTCLFKEQNAGFSAQIHSVTLTKTCFFFKKAFYINLLIYMAYINNFKSLTHVLNASFNIRQRVDVGCFERG